MLREEWAADSAANAECAEWERERSRVRPQIAAFLQRFLGGGVGLEQFRSTFDRRTRTDWDAFALKGASGAGFLNAPVTHAEHPVVLARQLRASLRVPKHGDPAAAQLAELIAAVVRPSLPLADAVRSDDSAAKSPVAPTLAVVFVTAWAHGPDAIEKLAEAAASDVD
jgi:hypothetical protein